jgi:hypothetical protein
MGREIIYPHGTELSPGWYPIASAPRDGMAITLGWVEGRRLRRERDSRWGHDHGTPGWDGGGNPTHWRPRS